MKKKILFFLILIILFFSSCTTESPETNNTDNNPSQNNTNNEWSYDAENHWHDESDFATHEWEEIVIQKPTYYEDGITKCICKICGYEKTKSIVKLSHVHTFSTEWTYDAGFHWHKATCGHDDIINEEEHDWKEEVIKNSTETETGLVKKNCRVCGYEKEQILPDLAPGVISNFVVINTGFETSKVSWRNPDNSDFEKVIVTYGNGNKAEFVGLPGETVTQTFSGLTNGIKNLFVFNCSDKNGNIGKSVSFNVLLYGGIFGSENNQNKQGTVTENLCISGKKIDKTNEVIIIPKGSIGVVAMPDDSSWSSYYKDIELQGIPDDYSGVFVKDRKIKLDSYSLGQYEVTSELYETVMKTNPSYHAGSKYYPVENITWYEACVFCNELTKVIYGNDVECVYYSDETLTKAFTLDDYTINPINGDKKYKTVYPAYDYNNLKWMKKGYRLPTEAEWEFAARGGDPNAECWSYAFAGIDMDRSNSNYLFKEDEQKYVLEDTNLDIVAWDYSNFNRETHEVGGKLPNSLGLFDMCGNVSEWCYDWYEHSLTYNDFVYFDGTYLSNPIGPDVIHEGQYFRCARSYNIEYSEAFFTTVSYRGFEFPGVGDGFVGIRLARSLE